MGRPDFIGDWVWEPGVPPSQYEADPASLTMIPECPGEPGVWVSPLADYRRGYWANSAKPARKLRVNSGIFTGSNGVRYLGATAGNNGPTEFWVHKVSSEVQQKGCRWWVNNSANIFERDGGQVNTAVVTRSPANGNTDTIGLISSVVGRNADFRGGVWSMYCDAIADTGHAGHARCGDFNVANKSAKITEPETPYTSHDGLRYVFGIAAGADADVHGRTFDVDHGLRFNNNGARFHNGIMFRSNSLVLDGSSEGRMIRAGKGHAFTWDAPDGTESARIVSTGTSAGVAWRMSMNDDDLSFGADGSPILRMVPTVGAVSYLQIKNSAGGAPSIRVVSAVSNADLQLVPQGTGVLQIGYQAAAAGPISSNRRIAVRDGAGNMVYLLATTVAPT